MQLLFIVCQFEYYHNILKPSCRPLAFTLSKACFEKKIGLQPVSLPYFLNDFWTKKIILLWSITWPNLIAWLSRQPSYNIINFEINLIFLIKPFFYMTQKSKQKVKYLEDQKSLGWNKKYFLSFLNGFYWSK